MADFSFVYLLPICVCYLFYHIISIYTPYTLDSVLDNKEKKKRDKYFLILSFIPIVNIILIIFLLCLIISQYVRKR